MQSPRRSRCAHCSRMRREARVKVLPAATQLPLVLAVSLLLFAGCHAYPPYGGGFQQGYPAYQTMPQGQIIQPQPQLAPGNVQLQPAAPNPIASSGSGTGLALRNNRPSREQLPWDPADEKPASTFGSGFDAGTTKKDGLVPEYKFDPSGSGSSTRNSTGADGSLSDTKSPFDADGKTPFGSEPAGSGFPAADPYRKPKTGSKTPTAADPVKSLEPFTSEGSGSSPRKTGDIFDELEQRKLNTDKKTGVGPGTDADGKFTPFKEEEYESGSAAVQPPMRITPAMTARPIINVSNETAEIPDRAYGYDRTSYRWLRGSLDFDHNDASWQIMYDRAPDPDDPYGGVLTLAADPRLQALKKSDIVVVAGFVDETTEDSFGKPVFHIEKIDVFE